jgi:hypothetical protein
MVNGGWLPLSNGGSRPEGAGTAVLMEDFFDAVDRAFTKEKDRIPVPSRLERKTPLELPLSVVGSPQATRSPQRRRVADRRHLPERRLPRA